MPLELGTSAACQAGSFHGKLSGWYLGGFPTARLSGSRASRSSATEVQVGASSTVDIRARTQRKADPQFEVQRAGDLLGEELADPASVDAAH